ncbi:unnamed protein product, partial [Mesorhabditis spiculigera]
MNPEFVAAVEEWKKMRARFDQRKNLKYEFELYVLFEEESLPIWALYQQAVAGNISVPKKDYHDPRDDSWMWGWMWGNAKWLAWNKLWGMDPSEAETLLIQEVHALKNRLPDLVEQWKDVQDPRIPDEKAWVPEDERQHWAEVSKVAKQERRKRSAAQRAHEESLGMWD